MWTQAQQRQKQTVPGQELELGLAGLDKGQTPQSRQQQKQRH
jgi:hypothetical protein